MAIRFRFSGNVGVDDRLGCAPDRVRLTPRLLCASQRLRRFFAQPEVLRKDLFEIDDPDVGGGTGDEVRDEH